MKKQTLAACLIAATITIVSCQWFSSNNKPSPLIGKWQIDSFDVKDSGKATINFIGLLFLASQKKDSVKMLYDFSKDSVTFYLTNKETFTTAYQFNPSKNELTIKDSSNQVLSYSKINDSIISLQGKDSLTFFLRKVK